MFRVDRCVTAIAPSTPWESKAEAPGCQELQQSLDVSVPSINAKRPRNGSRSWEGMQDALSDILNPWRTHPNSTYLSAGVPIRSSNTAARFVIAQDRATEFGRRPYSRQLQDGHRCGAHVADGGFFRCRAILLSAIGVTRKTNHRPPMYPRHYYEAAVQVPFRQIPSTSETSRGPRKRSSSMAVMPATRSTTGVSLDLSRPAGSWRNRGKDNAAMGVPLDQSQYFSLTTRASFFISA